MRKLIIRVVKVSFHDLLYNCGEDSAMAANWELAGKIEDAAVVGKDSGAKLTNREQSCKPKVGHNGGQHHDLREVILVSHSRNLWGVRLDSLLGVLANLTQTI